MNHQNEADRWQRVRMRLASDGVTPPEAVKTTFVVDPRPHPDVLARLRCLAITTPIVEGYPVAEVAPDIAGFKLQAALTRKERAWLAEEEEPSSEDGWQASAVHALAWALGLLDTTGPVGDEESGELKIRIRLDGESGPGRLRTDDELATELLYLTAYDQVYRGQGGTNQIGPLERRRVEVRLESMRWVCSCHEAWTL